MGRLLLDIITVLVDITIMSSGIESDFTWDVLETRPESCPAVGSTDEGWERVLAMGMPGEG